MHPASGQLAANSANTSATHSWPANTSGQVQKNAGPPKE
jgi:hypothetical protein